MTTRQDIAGVVNNDLVFTFNLTYNDAPLNLTGYTVSVVVKANQAALDSSGTTYTSGNGLAFISQVAGRFTLTIPRANAAAAGNSWYRVDITNGSTVSSAMCGVLNLMAA